MEVLFSLPAWGHRILPPDFFTPKPRRRENGLAALLLLVRNAVKKVIVAAIFARRFTFF